MHGQVRFQQTSISPSRLRAERIAALFKIVTLSVVGAALGALMLANEMVRLGAAPFERGYGWAGMLSLCAVAHVVLYRAYGRAAPDDDAIGFWALAFSAICLIEGLGWGWASVDLLPGDEFDAQLLVIVVVYAVSACSIPAFGSYLPAFFAFFLPTTIPFMVASQLSTRPVEHAATPLSLIFIISMGALAVRASRIFDQLVCLRLETEILAEDLQRQKEIAEQANLAKSTFLAAASHDLRQPVHALGLFVGALRSTALPPEAMRLSEQIEASVVAMDSLFTALLDISRLDAGVVEVRPQTFSIQPLLDRLCREHEAEADAKSVAIVQHRSSAAVSADPILLERVLRNLISNAVRYTDAGRIVVGCRRDKGVLSVEVRDTGRGIPAALQQKVFQEYFQLGNPERDRSKGLGLGLAIVRRMTDLMGCEIVVRSEPGRGSAFSIRVPLADPAAAVDIPVLDPQTPLASGGLIVVIDDEAAIRDAMSSQLLAWGFEVIAAAGGDDIIDRLATCPMRPDVIICDYRLRGSENGIDVIERLHSEYNEAIPAMLVTGDTAPDRLAEAEASGLLLLHKPVSRSKLRAGIASLTARARVQGSEADPEALLADASGDTDGPVRQDGTTTTA